VVAVAQSGTAPPGCGLAPVDGEAWEDVEVWTQKEAGGLRRWESSPCTGTKGRRGEQREDYSCSPARCPLHRGGQAFVRTLDGRGQACSPHPHTGPSVGKASKKAHQWDRRRGPDWRRRGCGSHSTVGLVVVVVSHRKFTLERSPASLTAETHALPPFQRRHDQEHRRLRRTNFSPSQQHALVSMLDSL
jgi:hypothetical protein